MHKILTVILVLAISAIVFAQQSYQDAVYLKNGSIIRGKIIELIPNTQLKIEIADRIALVYQFSEVVKYYKRTYPGTIKKLTDDSVKAPKRSHSFNLSGLKKGNMGIVELGYARGYGTGYLNFYKINIVAAHRITPCFSIGIGTGLRYFSPSTIIVGSPHPYSPQYSSFVYDSLSQLSSSIVIPFWADVRVNILSDHEFIPYFSLGIGYSLVATRKKKLFPTWNYPPAYDFAFYAAEQTGLFQGGFSLNPCLGVRCKISGKCMVNVSVGYELHRLTVLNRKEYSIWYPTGHGDLHGGFSRYLDNLSIVNSSRLSINSGVCCLF